MSICASLPGAELDVTSAILQQQPTLFAHSAVPAALAPVWETCGSTVSPYWKLPSIVADEKVIAKVASYGRPNADL